MLEVWFSFIYFVLSGFGKLFIHLTKIMIHMGTHYSVTGDDLLDWDCKIYDTLSQKSITKDVRRLEQTKQTKTS